MADLMIEAARKAVKAKEALGDFLALIERDADIGTRLYVRRLVDLFQFRLGFFLNRLDERPDAVAIGQFVFWYVRLPADAGEERREIKFNDRSLARQALIALVDSEANLTLAAALLLNGPISREPTLSSPIGAIGGARRVLELLRGLVLHEIEELPPGGPNDEHIWSYVGTMTAAAFLK